MSNVRDMDYIWHTTPEGDLTCDEFYSVQDSPEFSAPYPESYFRVRGGVITNSLLPELQEYSGRLNAQWFIENNILTNGILIEPDLKGAFANAQKLSEAIIPKSCKKIGRYAFRNTALREVVIARDCEYYPTSFPDGCRVKFYPD